ncbi:MAG: hypothetical protein SFZ24_00030 [Planctomycetota bacterium]|nr:hypothetical protein [Planctomycetota bacterium]
MRSALVGVAALSMIAGSASAQLEWVSVGPGGEQLISGVDDPSVSADGNLVLFAVYEDWTAVDPTDTNGVEDLYLRNMTTGEVARVNVDAIRVNVGFFSYIDGWELSGDGGTVVFSFNSELGGSQIYKVDIATGTVTLISQNGLGVPSNGFAYQPTVSFDGGVIAWTTSADNLGPVDTNFGDDVYLYDSSTGGIECISVNVDGQPASGADPSISGDGRLVAFQSTAPIAPGAPEFTFQIYLRDRDSSTTRVVSAVDDGLGGVTFGNAPSQEPSISSDGSAIFFGSSATNLIPVSRGFGNSRVLRAIPVVSRGGAQFSLTDVSPTPPPGLLLCDGSDLQASYNGNFYSADFFFCSFLPAGAQPGGSRGEENERGGTPGFSGLFLVRVEDLTSVQADVLNGISLNGYDHGMASGSLAIAFETDFAADPGDDFEFSEDVYLANLCGGGPFLREPLDDTETVGSVTTLYAEPAEAGSTLAFQWRFNGKPIEDDGRIQGASSPALTINPVQAGDEGVYQLVVNSFCSAFVSRQATLTVQPPACEGDVDGDGVVGFQDIVAVLRRWQQTCN